MNYNEETIVNSPNMDDEKTQVATSQTNEQPTAQPAAEKKQDWVKNVGIGTGAAVAAGVIATLFTSGTIEQAPQDDDSHDTESSDGLTTPVVTDGELAIAHSVTDDMSFGEAFAAAHDEVGPGGVFEWHGELYGTYTAQEWNSLSREEKAEYNSHLRVVRTPHYENNVTHHHTSATTTSHEEVAHHDEHHTNEHGHETEDVAVTTNHDDHNTTDEPHVVQTSNAEVEDDGGVEILGLDHVTLSDGSEVTVGTAIVEGDVVAVWDVDNDNEADLMSVDYNHNGDFDADEWSDIRDEHLAMSNFDVDNNTYDAPADDVDYMAEV